jgi:hypothetical protein
VERNVASTLELYAQLLNQGLTLGDNARGKLLTTGLTAPLVVDLEFILGKGAPEPLSVALVSLRGVDGTRYSGGVVRWSWSVRQSIGRLLIHALSSDVAAGTYEAVFFAVGE